MTPTPTPTPSPATPQTPVRKGILKKNERKRTRPKRTSKHDPALDDIGTPTKKVKFSDQLLESNGESQKICK